VGTNLDEDSASKIFYKIPLDAFSGFQAFFLAPNVIRDQIEINEFY